MEICDGSVARGGLGVVDAFWLLFTKVGTSLRQCLVRERSMVVDRHVVRTSELARYDVFLKKGDHIL